MQRLLTSLGMLALLVLGGCSTAPKGPSAQVRAACIPPAAAPAIPVEELYRRCRDAALAEAPEVPVPAVDWGRR